MVEYYDTTNRAGSIANAEKFDVDILRPVYLVYLDLLDEEDDAAPLYVNSSVYSISYGGNTYTGIGTLGSIEEIEEGSELQVYGTKLTLNAIPASMISTALRTKYRERDCVIRLGLYDASLVQIIVVEVFKGKIDHMEMTHGRTGILSVMIENALIDWERPSNRRYSHQDQKENYPTDTGLEFLSDAVTKEIRWGIYA